MVDLAGIFDQFFWGDELVDSIRGETSNSVDITNTIYTLTMNNLDQSGNLVYNSQSVVIEGNEVNVDGSDCNSNQAATMSIGNYNEIETSAMIDALAQAFADIVYDLRNDISTDVKSDLMTSINNSIKEKTDIKNKLTQQIEQNCNNINNYQSIKFLNNKVNIKCGSFNVTNKNVQKLDCMINAVSDVKQDVETIIKHKIETETGKDNNTLLIIIIVVSIIVIIFIIIFVIIFTKRNKVVKTLSKNKN